MFSLFADLLRHVAVLERGHADDAKDTRFRVRLMHAISAATDERGCSLAS